MTSALRFRLGIDQLLTSPPPMALYMYTTPDTSSFTSIFDDSDTVPRHSSRLAFYSRLDPTTPSIENQNRPTNDIRQPPDLGHNHN